MEEEQDPRSPHGWWRGFVGLGLTGAALALLAYRLDLDRAIGAMRHARYAYAAPLALGFVLVEVVGALNWRLILSRIKWVALPRLVGASMAGYLADLVTPVRIGPVVRAYLVGRREGVPIAAVLATTLVERLADGLGLVLILGAVLAAAPTILADQDLGRLVVPAGFVALAFLLAAAGVLVLIRRWGLSRSERPAALWRALPRAAGSKLRPVVEAFAAGTALPPTRAGIILVGGYALVKRVSAAAPMYFAALAFDVHLPAAAYLFQAVFVALVLNVGNTVGFKGGYEVGMILALVAFGIPREVALPLGVLAHVVSMLTVSILGLAYLWVEGIGLAEVQAAAR